MIKSWIFKNSRNLKQNCVAFCQNAGCKISSHRPTKKWRYGDVITLIQSLLHPSYLFQENFRLRYPTHQLCHSSWILNPVTHWHQLKLRTEVESWNEDWQFYVGARTLSTLLISMKWRWSMQVKETIIGLKFKNKYQRDSRKSRILWSYRQANEPFMNINNSGLATICKCPRTGREVKTFSRKTCEKWLPCSGNRFF